MFGIFHAMSTHALSDAATIQSAGRRPRTTSQGRIRHVYVLCFQMNKPVRQKRSQIISTGLTPPIQTPQTLQTAGFDAILLPTPLPPAAIKHSNIPSRKNTLTDTVFQYINRIHGPFSFSFTEYLEQDVSPNTCSQASWSRFVACVAISPTSQGGGK